MAKPASPSFWEMCESAAQSALLNLQAFLARNKERVIEGAYHTRRFVGVVDSGNAKRHLLKDPNFSPHGVKMVDISVTGVNGAEQKRVGIGPSVIVFPHQRGQWVHESRESVFMPECPCNLLCQNNLERREDNPRVLTGVEVRTTKECITVGDDCTIPMPRDADSGLYTVKIQPMASKKGNIVAPRNSRPNFRHSAVQGYVSVLDANNMRVTKCALGAVREASELEEWDHESYFQHVHIRPLTSLRLHKRVAHLNEKYLRIMAHHQVIDGLKGDKLDFRKACQIVCDSCMSGKHHSRKVKKSSGRAHDVVGADITSDIGGPMPVEAIGTKWLYFVLLQHPR